jgi:hypothetical protein
MGADKEADNSLSNLSASKNATMGAASTCEDLTGGFVSQALIAKQPANSNAKRIVTNLCIQHLFKKNSNCQRF